MAIAREYMQRTGESFEEWKYRLIIGKARKQINLSWNEICEVLNLPYRSEYIRKIAYGILEYQDWLEISYEDSLSKETVAARNRVRSELQEEREKIQREKMQLADQKREYNKAQRNLARAEHIQEEIARAAEVIAKTRPLEFKAPTENDSWPNREGALLLSDWHVGSRADNYWNTYDDAIMQKRVEELVLKTIEYGEDQKISKLHVFVLGDLISGLIHVNTRINNTENVVYQTEFVAEILARCLTFLASHFQEVVVYFARGNHDRVSANKEESITQESFFDFIPWYLKTRMSGVSAVKIVENTYDSEIISTTICGKNIFAVHGHRDKAGKVVDNLSQMLRIFPDYVFLGHFHHHEETETHNCEVVVNSSLSGVDDYAKELRRTSKAAQKFIVFDKDLGRLCTYNIVLN